MVFEVTLQEQRHDDHNKQKSCWFPFKKQVENRRSNKAITYDYDYTGVDFGKSAVNSKNNRLPPRNSPNGNPSVVVNRPPSFRSNIGNRKKTTAESVSTGTDVSYDTYDSNDDSGSSPTTTRSQHVPRNGSFLSYQGNHHHFLSSSNESVAKSFDDDESIMEIGPNGLPTEHPHNRDDEIMAMFPIQLSRVETNCMTKHFWTDEIVEGGAFACLKPRANGGIVRKAATACMSNNNNDTAADEETMVEVQVSPAGGRNVTFTTPLGKEDLKIIQEVRDHHHNNGPVPKPNQVDQRIQQSLRAVGKHHVPTGVLYISQEPEDIQQEAPLKRAFCTNVRLRKLNNGGEAKQHNHSNNKRSSSSQLSSISSSHPSSYQNLPESSGSSSLESAFLRGGLSSTRAASKNSADDAEFLPPLKDCSSSPSSPCRQSDDFFRKHQGTALVPPVDCMSKPYSNYPPSLPKPSMEEEEKYVPNFYIEVEAMREQLNRIRNLEDIQAEDKRLEKDIGLARTSSLVDGDSTFMESVFEDVPSDGGSEVVVKRPVDTKNRPHDGKSKKSGAWFWRTKNREMSKSKNDYRLPEKSSRNTRLMNEIPEDGSPHHDQQSQQQLQLRSVNEDHKKTKVSNRPKESQGLPLSSASPSKVTPSTFVVPDRSRPSQKPLMPESGRSPSHSNLEEQTITKRVSDNLKAVKQKEQSTSRKSDAHVMSATAAKVNRRREMLGLNSQESSETSSSSASSPSPSSSPSSKPESVASSSSSRTSFDSYEANSRKLGSPHRRSSLNRHALPKHSPPRTSPNERNAAKDAYFGRQKTKEEGYIPPSASWQAIDAFSGDYYGGPHDRPQAKAAEPEAPAFDEDFWEEGDEDACEINSAAFEEFDGDDSLFGDLKSNSDSKVSKESAASRMNFGTFNENLSTKSSDHEEEFSDPNDDDDSRQSRSNQSGYSNGDQSSYSGAEGSRYTTERSRYTAGDESRYTTADTSRYTTGDQSRYTRDSRYSRGGETSYLSKGSVSRFVDENDGAIVAAIDKWLF
ncbi:hypothetical protein IV203_038155 [Nitzschia inconspicua]|uniref:Uncharacterized protein n=1 Tax=Nitzschia inconspicua TaxID=303405 RepID=A0A9K3LMX4_9STRA|nr:hypothetical protein IV203_038155 [Nitzschia inconspicua]